jgi:hypothetical protein
MKLMVSVVQLQEIYLKLVTPHLIMGTLMNVKM